MKQIALLVIILLAGCSSQASRMYDCESKGISRDACYVAEQNRQSAITAAAEKQAMENAQSQSLSDLSVHHHRHATQYAQSAKKKAIYKGYGQIFKMNSKNFTYLNDSLCAIDEDNADATTYQSGLYNVIIYHHTGKVALMKQGQFVGYLK
jgi:Type IV conjugative transfer system lipoprotein (TraV).